ncbi:MAG TPA: glycosyltransferase family 4 protein [Actinomycetes bacterium]|nr:glycosyltransferase family 4 protein [Actinomycetes bacterium]
MSEDNRLRIAMIAPPWYPVPPNGYGGIEAMVADLITGLDGRGHDVVLIGAGPAGEVPGRYLATFEEAPTERIGEGMPELLHLARAARFLNEQAIDVVHDHTAVGPLTARGRAAPTIVTAHGPVDDEIGEYYRDLGTSVSLVAISESQRRQAPDLHWSGVVHNAIDVSSYPYREDKDDFALFLGRCNPEKGVHLAIDAARAAGRRIVLAAKINEQPEQEYFDAAVRPRLGPDVEHVGEADADEKRQLMAAAYCFLFPIRWEEPFGLVMIEAMACGTPVVALGRGAVPEVVADGVTGFVRTELDQLPEAIDGVSRVSAADCREHVERNFDLKIMTAGYERIYRSVLQRPEDARATG